VPTGSWIRADGGLYVFAHDKIRDVVYAEAGEARWPLARLVRIVCGPSTSKYTVMTRPARVLGF